MAEVTISIVGEGDIDAAVAQRLLMHRGMVAGAIHITRGKARLDRQLGGYRRAAEFGKWFVMRDLDRDADCAPGFLSSHGMVAGPRLAFRIAVRAVEAWILADRESASKLLDIPVSRVPGEPDDLGDPKQWIIEQARHARHARVKVLAPGPGTSARVGPGYTSTMLEHVVRTWDPDRASESSPSLASCLVALDVLRDAR